MKKPNYEDFIMKRAMDIFAEEGLKFFGIDKKVKDNGFGVAAEGMVIGM